MTTVPRENKEHVQRCIRESNGKHYDRVAELLTVDYTRHDPDTPGNERGPEPFVEALRQLHEAFPDSEVHVGEIVAENDLVAFEGTMTGTHEGVFRGIEPTHKTIEIPGNAMHRVSDGRIAETWATWNFLGALGQLGVTELPRR
jgi:steroid delta-isomerase-like uncharacterized protein